MIHYDYEQGTQEWLDARKGVITGSRFKDARSLLKSGKPDGKCLGYAMDVARERVGGTVPKLYQNAAMTTGKEQEPIANTRYELQTGYLVEPVGFYTTEDNIFGLSPDGLINNDGVLEIKTLVASGTVFDAWVDQDYSAYESQCLGYLWLLGRQWVDLVLWIPDFNHLHIHRIERDEEKIEILEADMLNFAVMVTAYESKLRLALQK